MFISGGAQMNRPSEVLAVYLHQCNFNRNSIHSHTAFAFVQSTCIFSPLYREMKARAICNKPKLSTLHRCRNMFVSALQRTAMQVTGYRQTQKYQPTGLFPTSLHGQTSRGTPACVLPSRLYFTDTSQCLVPRVYIQSGK